MKRMLTVATLLITGIALAQNYESRTWMPLENRIGIAIGIGSVTYLDKNSSPLVYQSRPKNLRLFYNLESNKFIFSVDLDVKMGSNTLKYHKDRTLFFQEEDYKGNKEDKKFPVGGSFMAGRISLGAYYKISSAQEPTFKVAVGGRIMNEMFYPQGWNTSGIFNALSFSPEALTQHRVNEHHQFTASVRIPVVARLSRLPYDNTVSAPGKNQVQGFFRNSSWVGLSKFLAPAMTIGYNYQLNTSWGTGLSYELGGYNIQTPQQMKMLSQSILANFHHQF
ncbi:MAG: hypothetical protein JST43_00665 [Bacteroidetes bacterium]|nr:hypothetical protein [Bacteroidota bacterium]MBS1540739.1 hypothetical protein [Bacteroidota bacterium]